MNHQLFWLDENEYSSISPIGSPCSRVERSFGSRFLEIPPNGWNAFETQSTPKSNSNPIPENKLEHGKKTRIKFHEGIGVTEDETSSVWSSAPPSPFPIRLPLRPVHIEEEYSFESSLTCSSASNVVDRSFGSRSFEILRDGDAFETQSTPKSNSNRTPENKLEHGKTTGVEGGEDISLTESETGPSASSSLELPIRMKLSLGAQVVNKITELIGDLSLNYEEKIQSMSKYIEFGKRRESELVVTISSIQQKYDKVLSDFQKLTEEHSKLQQRNAMMETIEIEPGSTDNHVLVNCECSVKLLNPLNEVSILNTKLESTVLGCQFEQKVENIVSAGALEEDSHQGKGSESSSDNVDFFEYTSLVSSCCGSHMGFQNREDPRMIVCNSVCLSVMNNDNKLKRTGPHTVALVDQTVPLISPERPWKEHPGTVPSSDNMFTDSVEYKSAGINGGKCNTLKFSPMSVSDFSSGLFTDSLGYKAADSTGGERNKVSISSMPVSDFSTWMFTDSVEYKSADNNGGKHNQVTVSPVSNFYSGMFTDLTDSGEYKSADNNGGNQNQVSFSSCGGGSVRIGNTVELVSYPQKSSLEACQNKGRSINEIDAKPKTVLDIDFNRAIFKRDPNPSPAVAEGGKHATVVGCGNDSGQKSSASHTMSSPRTKVTSRRTQPWTTCWRWNYRRSHTHEGRIARPKSTVLEN